MIIGDTMVYNEAISLYEKLSDEFEREWNSITLCSAFLSESAANSIIDLIEKIENVNNLKITIMVGTKNNFTSPSSIKILINYVEKINKNIDVNLRLPLNEDFHMKSYVFIGDNQSKAIVGSANLTDTGLKSKGELMIDINDEETVDEVIEYLDEYLNESVEWEDYIDEYSKIYEKYKPVINNSKMNNLLSKPIRKKSNKRMTIRFTAPTMGTLHKISREVSDRVDNIFEFAKRENKNIISSYSIIYSDVSEEDIKDIKNEYVSGYYFDRPIRIGEEWNIGDSRAICRVGAIVNTLEDEIVMFMKRGCIHYKVTDEIIKIAEKYGIKNDEDYTPENDSMDKYKNFILEYRKTIKNK
ncbi:NgoFVII family restriction endonuclease [Paraclostridium bifermentans]|uniref:NgoFVII family restriction endonuclease n=1 Tax=Paraclostridium bifermentans TaxID=1490 RepID=A0AA44IH07_PARBF|nr:restriction endonuclease PLD domain-containing protein [Paraclostridium bifermentans]NME09460.1 NgoFVII family restriction endonuclease [Paraclostridium bifermentans]